MNDQLLLYEFVRKNLKIKFLITSFSHPCYHQSFERGINLIYINGE